jgi:hypothetical protein
MDKGMSISSFVGLELTLLVDAEGEPKRLLDSYHLYFLHLIRTASRHYYTYVLYQLPAAGPADTRAPPHSLSINGTHPGSISFTSIRIRQYTSLLLHQTHNSGLGRMPSDYRPRYDTPDHPNPDVHHPWASYLLQIPAGDKHLVHPTCPYTPVVRTDLELGAGADAGVVSLLEMLGMCGKRSGKMRTRG